MDGWMDGYLKMNISVKSSNCFQKMYHSLFSFELLKLVQALIGLELPIFAYVNTDCINSAKIYDASKSVHQINCIVLLVFPASNIFLY